MDAKLARAEEWLRLALQSARAVAWEWDLTSGSWQCFGDLSRVFGITSGTLKGTAEGFRAFVHPGDRDRVEQEMVSAIRGGESYSSEFSHFQQGRYGLLGESERERPLLLPGTPECMMGLAVDITERHLAEAQQRISEQRFRQFFATLPEYCYIVSPEGRIIDANAAACEALGYGLEELVGQPLSMVYAPESLPKMKGLFETWQATDHLRGEEMVIVTRTGEKRNVLLYAGAVHDADGKLLHSTSIQIDITERKRALEEVRAGEERLRLAARAGNMYAFEWDPVTDKVFRSQECASVLGMAEEPQWITAADYFPTIHPEDRPGFERLIAGLNPANSSYQTSFRLLRPDAPQIWVEENGHAFFGEQGKMVRLVGMVANITARKQAEEKLEASERLNRTIVLGSPVAMVVSRGKEESAELINDKFTSLFGYTREEMPDVAHWWPLAYPDEAYRERIGAEWRDAIDVARASGTEVKPIEARVRCKDGSVKDIEFHLAHLGETNLVSFVDLTERKRTEQEMRELHKTIAHLNRVASMGQMVAALTHELGQPLTALLSNAQAAGQFASGADADLIEIRAALTDIAEDATRAGAILQNLRALFQKRSNAPHEVDLNQVVTDVRRLMRNDAQLRGVQLQLSLAGQPVKVQADEVPLQQVIVNLVNNSMDAMNQLPAPERLLTIRTSQQPETNSGVIVVEDNGPGISDADRVKLFTPFYTTKNEGLGMGLCICRTILSSLGGCIKLESRAQPGAAFRVELPLCPETGR